MAYSYETQRYNLFSESGQRLFLKVRDNTFSLIRIAGAVRAEETWRGCSGDTWDFMACNDRMVELDEIREVTGPGTPGQLRVFVRVRESTDCV